MCEFIGPYQGVYVYFFDNQELFHSKMEIFFL